MSTTSVVPAVLDAIATTLKASPYEYKVFEAWPGPSGANRMLFFGDAEWTEYAIPTIKAARKQRQEEFTIGWDQWTFGGEGKPSNVKPTRDDAYEAFSHFEDALADDPTLGLGTPTIQSVQLTPTLAGPFTFERGWGYHIEGFLTVRARLT